MKIIKKIIIKGELELLTGLHIGDSKDNVEIGGVDSPVIRRKDNNQPYIPGSSLKGKIRSLLEIATGTNAKSNFKFESYKNSKEGELIPKLFGCSDDNNGNPSRIIVRDAYLTKDSAQKLYNSDFTDLPYTEIKYENVINRISGKAEHPRQIERVPAGVKFEVEFVINILEEEKNKEQDYINLLEAGIRLLEDDYLGGNGSRGYGKVKWKLTNKTENTVDKYFNKQS